MRAKGRGRCERARRDIPIQVLNAECPFIVLTHFRIGLADVPLAGQLQIPVPSTQ